MTKIQVKVVLFCTVFFFATIFLLSGQVWATSGEEVEIEADVLEYDPATGIMNAFGNVKLRQDEITITTSQLFYCREDGMVRTNETVHFQSSTLDLTGEGLWYSLSTREGEIKEVKGQGKEVYFSGRAGIISPDDFTVRDGSYTTCELANPCFNISARKVRIDEEYVKIGFGWLELKGLKVLPLPPLRLPTDMDWPDLEAGYTNERGLFVGVTTEQPVSERVRYSYGGSIGTKKWLSLDAGLTWQAGKVSINTTGSYRINGAHIFNTIWRYT
ncbi:MAG TPA: LPS export ABC transporter periplasmic protein LptC, partial [Bacillota bacterium]